MIKGFEDTATENVFNGESPGKSFPAGVVKVARRKLMMIHLDDLKVPPKNCLEAQKKRSGRTALDQDQRSIPRLLQMDWRWRNLQTEYDLRRAAAPLGTALDRITPLARTTVNDNAGSRSDRRRA